MITSMGSIFFGPNVEPLGSELKKAGWRFLGPRNAWTTADIQKAVPFISKADPKTKMFLEKWVVARQEAVAASVAATATLVIPSPEGLSYRGYQTAGVDFMRQRKYSLNADAPRLGKTIQSIGLVNLARAPAKVLVICPSNAKPGWCREANKWLVHKTTVGMCEGGTNPDTDFLVINYELLGRHLKTIGSRQWDYIFVDEAHFLGNPKSARTQNVMSLDADKHFVFLTGTPIYTRPLQLWAMLERLDPKGLGANWWRFVKRYCNAHIDEETGRWDFNGYSNGAELQFRMRETFMVRREKSDVYSELPTSRETVLLPRAGLEKILKKEESLVSKNLSALFDKLKGEMSEDDWNVLGQFDGRNDIGGEVADVRREIAIAKCPMVVEFVEDLLQTEAKVVVFTHHRDVTKILSKAFTPYGVATVIGGMTSDKREEERRRFQEDPQCRVFVGNITSAGSAIELSAADVAVFAELSWVPSEIDQAEERIWLPTKTQPLTVYRLVIENGVEYMMSVVLEGRQEAISRIMLKEHLQLAG